MKMIKGNAETRCYTDDYTFDVTFSDVKITESSEGLEDYLTDALDDYVGEVTVIIDDKNKIVKLLNYAKDRLQSKIVMIEMDIDSGFYGTDAIVRLEDKLVDYRDELEDVKRLLGEQDDTV
jgi:hypothetical protein